MNDVNDGIPERPLPPLPSLLTGAFEDFRAALLAGSLPGLRPSHYRVMSLIPDGGLRLNELASRASITKAGIGQFIGYLQREGYVKLAGDPTDNRAKIVTLTPEGVAAVELSRTIIAETEARWKEALGAERYQELCRSLLEVGALPRPGLP